MKNAILIVALLLGGCAGVSDAVRSNINELRAILDRSVTQKEDGTIPAVEAAWKAGKLYANPTDIVTWNDLLKTLGYILGGGLAVGGGGTAATKIYKAVKNGKAEAEKKGE